MDNNNTTSQQHEMHLAKTHSSGAQEWFCPTCSRRLLMQWEPLFNLVVLEAGNDDICHAGSTIALHFDPPQIHPVEEPDLSDDLLAALEEALKDIDFDNWPGAED